MLFYFEKIEKELGLWRNEVTWFVDFLSNCVIHLIESNHFGWFMYNKAINKHVDSKIKKTTEKKCKVIFGDFEFCLRFHWEKTQNLNCNFTRVRFSSTF